MLKIKGLLENYIIPLTNVTPINDFKKGKKKKSEVLVCFQFEIHDFAMIA